MKIVSIPVRSKMAQLVLDRKTIDPTRLREKAEPYMGLVEGRAERGRAVIFLSSHNKIIMLRGKATHIITLHVIGPLLFFCSVDHPHFCFSAAHSPEQGFSDSSLMGRCMCCRSPLPNG